MARTDLTLFRAQSKNRAFLERGKEGSRAKNAKDAKKKTFWLNSAAFARHFLSLS